MSKTPKLGADTPNRGNAGKGRPKGAKNKITKDVRAMVLASLNKIGGEQYLVDQSKANPTAYMTLVGKCMPTKVEGDPDNPVKHIHEVIMRGVRAA